jgi:dethiobiotin synthetase
MPGPIVLVTGVGTGVGKTHAAEALVRVWARARRIAAYKPIESGVVPGVTTDQDRLDTAATFHVKHPRLELAEPISPHLAARREGRSPDLAAFRAHVTQLADASEGVVVELAGGAFSPIDDQRTNADLLDLWPTARVVLVGLDRLGILHEVLATTKALAPRTVHLVLLNAPAEVDASTGTNADELRRLTALPVAVLPRAAVTNPDLEHAAERAVGLLGLGASR